MDYSLLKELYETERKLSGRNFAKEHSFEEWVERRNQTISREAN